MTYISGLEDLIEIKKKHPDYPIFVDYCKYSLFPTSGGVLPIIRFY